MHLHIPEPAKYYCEEDEDHFFSWLQDIPAIKSVQGTPQGLDLTIITPIDQLSFYQLVGLMARYQLEMYSLRPLCENHANPWFTDKKNYWHKFVFGRK
jgi:hypothetical protein